MKLNKISFDTKIKFPSHSSLGFAKEEGVIKGNLGVHFFYYGGFDFAEKDETA
jgi:hypothetical protein